MWIIRLLTSRFTRFRRLQCLHAEQVEENHRLHLEMLELQDEVACLEAEINHKDRQYGLSD